MTEPKNDTNAVSPNASQESERDKLIRETARIPWQELQRHFAAGAVIFVSDTLDLIDVALQIAGDNTQAVSQWMANHLIGKVSDVQAEHWLADQAVLWTVVVKPWVLVQHTKPAQQAPAGTSLH